MDCVEATTGNAVLSGNGVCYLERHSKTGRAEAINIADYNQVTVYEDLHTTRRWYHFSGPGMPFKVVAEGNVLHIKSFSLNGKTGLSTLQHARQTYETPLYADRYVNETYNEGGYGGGIITSPKDMKDTAQTEISRYVSNMQRAGRFPVLDDGMVFSPNKFSPEDIGYIATKKFNKEELASMYRVGLPLLQDRDFLGKVSTQEVVKNHVKFCLRAWARRWEEELERKLLLPQELRNTRIVWNFDPLLKGDHVARADYITKMMTAQVMTVNEGRQFANLSPREDGDRMIDFQKSKEIDKKNENTDPNPSPNINTLTIQK